MWKKSSWEVGHALGGKTKKGKMNRFLSPRMKNLFQRPHPEIRYHLLILLEYSDNHDWLCLEDNVNTQTHTHIYAHYWVNTVLRITRCKRCTQDRMIITLSNVRSGSLISDTVLYCNTPCNTPRYSHFCRMYNHRVGMTSLISFHEDISSLNQWRNNIKSPQM